MKVAIWGSYSYGNYGDELMALQFAAHLKRIGGEPIVYGLDQSLAQQFGVETASTAEQLLQQATFCVFGGGSLLSRGKSSPQWYVEAKEREYREFTEQIESNNCPLYFLSIGGDGRFTSSGGFADFRRRLLSSPCCQFATVRQSEDVATLRDEYGLRATFYPDVLLDVSKFWEIDRGPQSDGMAHIGLCLPRSERRLLDWLRVMAFLRRDVVYHFIATVRSEGTGGRFAAELLPKKDTAYFRCHPYSDPVKMLKLLSTLDLMVTTKLHVGLTTLAFGVPYVCAGRSLKVKAFLDGIGAKFGYLGDYGTVVRRLKVLQVLSSRSCLDGLRRAYGAVDLAQLQQLSRGHLESLTAIYESHKSGTVYRG